MKKSAAPRRRGSSSPLTLVPVDPASEVPLYRQIYDSLRDAIRSGRLAAGTRVPTTRILASDLRVSRNTAAAALELLRAEGYVEVRAKSGTFVSSVPPESAPLATPATRSAAAPVSAARVRSPAEPRLSRSGLRLLHSRNRLMEGIKEGCRPFRFGVPAFDAFPYDVWNRLTNRYIQSHAAEEIGYGPPEGHPLLRQEIAAHVTSARGARCTPAQIVITNGAQHALDIIARMLLDPGDTVWVEDPGYPGSRAAFESVGASILSVPVDVEGIDIHAGDALQPPRLLYTTPSHQFPLGVSMSAARRASVLQYADATDAWIVEDDYDSEFRYESRPLICLQGLDRQHRVLYVGTFSKMLFPGLRLGYLIVPPDLVEAAGVIRSITDRHSSMLDQGVLSAFIQEGHLGRHMRRMRTLYKERRDTAVHALERRVPLIDIANTDAGLHFVGWLPLHMDDTETADECFEAGVDVAPLSDFVWGAPLRPALLFGFAAFTPEELEEAVDRVAGVLA